MAARESQGEVELLAEKVPRVSQGCQALLVLLASLALLAYQVLKAQWVSLALRVPKVWQVPVVKQVYRESQLHQETLDHRVLKECKEREVRRDHKGPLGLLDFREHQATLDS